MTLIYILFGFDWFVKNFNMSLIFDFVLSVATSFTVLFAYRSAKISEQANKASFSPILKPISSQISGDRLSVTFQNISNYHFAYAKSIRVYLDGVLISERDSLDPDHEDTIYKYKIERKDVVNKKISIKYLDILKNKFETIFTIKADKEEQNYFNVQDWQYIQK